MRLVGVGGIDISITHCCVYLGYVMYTSCMQQDMKENYLKNVTTPLARFSNFLKGKTWLAGNTVSDL